MSTGETKKEVDAAAPPVDPFAQFVGAEITFCCANAQGDIYLAGNQNAVVSLCPSTFGGYVGTQWRVVNSSKSSNSYQIVNNAQNTLLDGDGTSVSLSTGSDPNGTRWKANPTSTANCYTIENLDNGDNKYLAYQNGVVCMTNTSTDSNGTCWRIGYVYLTQQQVASSVQKAFSKTVTRASTSQLRSMDSTTTTQIWIDNNTKNQPNNQGKFGSSAFSDLFQNSVNQFINNDTSKYAAAFGGLYAVNSKGTTNAFNFFINPYLQLVMFDPVSGSQVSTAGWTASIIYI